MQKHTGPISSNDKEPSFSGPRRSGSDAVVSPPEPRVRHLPVFHRPAMNKTLSHQGEVVKNHPSTAAPTPTMPANAPRMIRAACSQSTSMINEEIIVKLQSEDDPLGGKPPVADDPVKGKTATGNTCSLGESIMAILSTTGTWWMGTLRHPRWKGHSHGICLATGEY